jgi:hypothetical protein
MFAYCFPCNGCFSFRMWLQLDGLRSEEQEGNGTTCNLSTPKNILDSVYRVGWIIIIQDGQIFNQFLMLVPILDMGATVDTICNPVYSVLHCRTGQNMNIFDTWPWITIFVMDLVKPCDFMVGAIQRTVTYIQVCRLMPMGQVAQSYSDWLRAGWSGGRILVGARFSAPVQTGPGAHPASCTMGTGSFPGVASGRGMTLTPLVPRSKNRVELYLYPP